jgi:hypothetical protein
VHDGAVPEDVDEKRLPVGHGPGDQGLTLVHFSAQRERSLLGGGCI